MEEIKSITFIGAGNVATHLAKALYLQNYKINQIFSRTLDHALTLAKLVEADAVTNLNDIQETDLLIFSVPDDALESIYKQFQNFKGILAHTSGISDLDFLLNRKEARVGYFYPLQTFRKGKKLNLRQTPFFINARLERDKILLVEVAQRISDNVKIIDDLQKKQLHLSAVVVNNFVNHLFGLTKENLERNNLNLTDLKPIIETTIRRAMAENPFEIQTGPAIRNDKQTIEQHLDLIKNNEEFQRVYRCLSESIQRKHKLDK